VLPYILTSSDDMLIKLWDWDKGWACVQVFEGHSHYVMQVRVRYGHGGASLGHVRSSAMGRSLNTQQSRWCSRLFCCSISSRDWQLRIARNVVAAGREDQAAPAMAQQALR
jgi:WD40 repeat protein